MTKRKFTDEEVIKALECCANADCLNCPRWSEQWTTETCADFLPSVLDLVKRLLADKFVLQGIVAQYEQIMKESSKEHAHQMELLKEIEDMLVGGQSNDPPSMPAGLPSEIG